jgi:hypothetical protein
MHFSTACHVTSRTAGALPIGTKWRNAPEPGAAGTEDVLAGNRRGAFILSFFFELNWLHSKFSSSLKWGCVCFLHPQDALALHPRLDQGMLAFANGFAL